MCHSVGYDFSLNLYNEVTLVRNTMILYYQIINRTSVCLFIMHKATLAANKLQQINCTMI